MKRGHTPLLRVVTGWLLCCALIACAGDALAQSATANGPGALPENNSAASVTSAMPAAGTASRAALEDDPELHVIGGTPSAPRSATTSDRSAARTGGADPKRADDGIGFFGMLLPLVAVLGVLALVFWGVRRFVPGVRRMGGSPAIRVVARTWLAPRQSVALVKVGRRLVVVGQSAESLSSLGTIESAEEVSELLGQCESASGDSSTASFRKVFKTLDSDFERELTGDEGSADGAVRAETAGAEEMDGETVSRVRRELDSLTRKVRDIVGPKR